MCFSVHAYILCFMVYVFTFSHLNTSKANSGKALNAMISNKNSGTLPAAEQQAAAPMAENLNWAVSAGLKE